MIALSPFAFDPPVLAHRGARAHAPENTLAAFRRARDDGARWIETDVKLTQDGIPIIMHDDALERTTSGAGKVAETVWADIEKLDAGSWFGPAFKGERVPSLADALRLALELGLRVNLELKPSPGRAQATAMVTLIEAAKIWPKDTLPPLISSFDAEALVIAAGLHPEWPRGLLLEAWRDDWQELARKTQARAIHIGADKLTQTQVGAINDARMPVLVYTVNDAARARELLRWGVKAIFCDDPGAMIKALKD